MSASCIMVVDDEQDIVWTIRRSLSNEGYDIVTAYDGAEALAITRRMRPDLVILDVIMPRLGGIEVCRSLRRNAETAGVPILILSERDGVEDRVRGLDEGADDYLGKPFHLSELKARVRALLRRNPTTPGAPPVEDTLTAGGLVLHRNTSTVVTCGRDVLLTPAELELLSYLMTHPGQIFSSQQLLREVWGYPPESAEGGLVRWHVMNLRSKVEPDPAHPTYIRTVPRHGYMLFV